MTEPTAGWYDEPNLAPASGKRGMPLWGWLAIAGGVFAIVAAAGVGVVLWALNMHSEPIAAAREAIATYDAAWVNADCAALERATTEQMREDWGYDDFDAFVKDATDFDERNRSYTTTVRDESYQAGVVTVVTVESYTDADGTRYTDRVTYTVIEDNGVWRIDVVLFEEGQGSVSHV